jgi:hypothetical protein
MALTVEDIKTLLLIPAENTRYDSFLAVALPRVISFVKQYCNRDFIDPETGEEVYPPGIDLVIAQLCRCHIKENQMQIETMRGGNNYNNAMLPLYPPELLTALNQWRHIRYVPFKEEIL